MIFIKNNYANTRKKKKNHAKTRVKLTEVEFNLLKLLVSNAGEELSRIYILDNIFYYGYYAFFLFFYENLFFHFYLGMMV